MPHCTKCGATVSEDASFCQNCGQPQASVVPAAVTSTSARSGLSENAAALLSYALGWITGIIFLLIDTRPSVRFHAAQSIVTFGGLHILRIALGMPFGVGWWFGGFGHWGGFGMGVVLLSFLGLLTFILDLHGEGVSGRAIQAAFGWSHRREYRWQVRAPGARMNFGTTFDRS